MLKCICFEYSQDAIRTGAEEPPFAHLATESPIDSNIHPLDELSLLVEDVDMAITGQRVNFLLIDRNSNEHFVFDFFKFSGLGLHDFGFG